MIHQLKTTPNFFQDIVDGKKKFEVRVNDRNFKNGDFLALNCVDNAGHETFRCAIVKVTYCMSDPMFCLPGMVIMSIDLIQHLS